MTALHIIGENFKLWFCIDGSPFGQQQILVALVCIGLLRVGTHKDFTIENASALVVGDSLIKLITQTIGNRVINQQMIIYKILLLREVKSLEIAFRMFAGK